MENIKFTWDTRYIAPKHFTSSNTDKNMWICQPIFFEKIVDLNFGWGPRRSEPINSIFTPDLWFRKNCRYTNFEKNRRFVSHDRGDVSANICGRRSRRGWPLFINLTTVRAIVKFLKYVKFVSLHFAFYEIYNYSKIVREWPKAWSYIFHLYTIFTRSYHGRIKKVK